MSDAIVLAPRLDLSAASDLKTTLLEATTKNTILDFSEVKFLGALCLQVLIAAARSCAENETSFELVNVSERVEDQMRVVGVTPETLTRGLT